jgi:glycosyltransferase involved in cell wall biosynthesis
VTKAKVSICIPTFSAGSFLSTAIESVPCKGFADYELIVLDDASTDATPDLVRSYVDPRLCYIRFERQLGQAGAWHRCVALARAEYVRLLHADNIIPPGFSRRTGGLES